MSAIRIRIPKRKHFRSLARREQDAAERATVAGTLREPNRHAMAAAGRLRRGENSTLIGAIEDALCVWIDSGNDRADFRNSKEVRNLLRDLWPAAFADAKDKSMGTAIRRVLGAAG